MKSLKELYKIGVGPSSSHTMGPDYACKTIKNLHPDAIKFTVTLYGSLSLTGKGHGTDEVIKDNFGSSTKIIFDSKTSNLKHPNTMDVIVDLPNGQKSYRIYSVGGGSVEFEGEVTKPSPNVYRFDKFEDIKEYCIKNNIRLSEYVFEEEPQIYNYLSTIWNTMKASIERGLSSNGELPGGLRVKRKANILLNNTKENESPSTKENRLVCAYAYAVAEENASRGTIVTAPTCGASGVLPAVLYYMYKNKEFSEDKIIKALAVAGLIGNVIKTNASISGADCGCQAEIGSACTMAAGALAELYDMQLDQIEYASEVAMEHHLGLTCDPVYGLVQIPCIERNAVAAMRAINAVSLAEFLTHTRKISLDTIIQTMYETGKDLSVLYKETSTGGLAKLYKLTLEN